MRSIAVALLGAFGLSIAAHAADGARVYDAGVAFSATANPSGVWQYGSSRTTGLAAVDFALSNYVEPSGPIVFRQPDAGHYPYVAASTSHHTVTDPTKSWALRPHELALEASALGQPAVVRFVAPAPGRYRTKARFAGIHFRLSTTDVHVRVNDQSAFDAIITGYGGAPAFHAIAGASPRASYVGTHTLAAGDVVVFAVGYGPNHTHFNDTTGLRARVVRMSSRR